MAEAIVEGRAPADWAMRAAYEAESGLPFGEPAERCAAWVAMWRDSWASAVEHAPQEATGLAEAVEGKYADQAPTATGSYLTTEELP